MSRPDPRPVATDPVSRSGGGPVIVCAGGAVVDRHLCLLAPPVPGTSNPSTVSTSTGGVARNVAENLTLLGASARLVSRVGDDDAGRLLLSALRARGVDVSAVVVDRGAATAQYVAVLDPRGELVIAAAAMDVLDGITADDLEPAWPAPRSGCEASGCCSATSTRRRPCSPPWGRCRTAARTPWRRILSPTAPVPWCSPWAREGRSSPGLGVRAIPAVPARVVDVTGAGDALVAGTLSRLAQGETLDAAVRVGVAAAAFTVASPFSVRPDVTAGLVLLHTEHQRTT